jgi:hypothetical protein
MKCNDRPLKRGMSKRNLNPATDLEENLQVRGNEVREHTMEMTGQRDIGKSRMSRIDGGGRLEWWMRKTGSLEHEAF